MRYIEVVVNVPIRRTFRRDLEPPPGQDTPEADSGDLQIFHYHLPTELEDQIQPGHLVWAPFGRQQVQGVVIRRSESAPLSTKPIQRLARQEPVMTPAQLTMASWIATTYVAPLSEAVKLFLPPGLLSKHDGTSRARARRELRIRLCVDPSEARRQLTTLARWTQQAAVLAWLLEHQDPPPLVATLMAGCRLKSRSSLHTLEKRGLIALEGEQVVLSVSRDQAATALESLLGLDRYSAVIDALAAANDGPLWQSELYAQVDTDLATLRRLEVAGLIELSQEIRFRDPLAGRSYRRTTPLLLTSEQAVVWNNVAAAIEVRADTPRPLPFLLHGVTGSGKTEIYLRAIDATLARGRQAIVLVPEIALTPQTVARFAGRFPGRVTVIHSGLSDGERYDVWRALRDGHFDVVVGPRSALFAPLQRLGLIVLDEEHEATYKQNAEEWGSYKVFYDARAVARRLATLTDSVLIMGSATPSLESYYAAEQGEFTLLEMPRRVLGHGTTTGDGPTAYAELPPVEIVDMRQELRAGNRSIFSRSLASLLYATLDAGEQTILFLNRRGTNTFVLCRDCGHVEQCPRCDAPLTYHAQPNQLICHHCNRRYPPPEICPQCHGKRIKFFGAGTERIEEAVQEIAPRARVLRWDADTTTAKGSHEAILAAFSAHEADVLIGTQMIAKGLDLPMVTLVGVIAADVGLFLPDFRSGERTFQLLTQVAGRAGRSARGGRVIIQTYRPEHHALQAAAQHDYAAFYRRELAFRQEHAYPPVRRLARLILWGTNLNKVKDESERMAAALRYRLGQMGLEGQWAGVLGPAPAFLGRIRGNYRWQILLRAPDPAAVLRGMDFPFGWRVDVDPASIL